jgi:RNA polymerase sigma-70 factor (ECF subfamily)
MPEERHGAPGEADLLGRLRSGDEKAFDDLVRLYRREIYSLAWRLTGDAVEADDIAQETFLRAYRALPGFRGEATLRAWLRRIASNLSLNLIQSARLTRRDDVEIDERPSARQGGEEAVIGIERSQRLGPALQALPPRQRMTLVLRVSEGLRFKEIARMMGCTTGTAKANFFHAVQALKRALRD